MNFSCIPQHDRTIRLVIIGTTSIVLIVWFWKTILKLPKQKLWDEKEKKDGYINDAMITQPLNTKLLLTRNPE